MKLTTEQRQNLDIYLPLAAVDYAELTIDEIAKKAAADLGFDVSAASVRASNKRTGFHMVVKPKPKKSKKAKVVSAGPAPDESEAVSLDEAFAESGETPPVREIAPNVYAPTFDPREPAPTPAVASPAPESDPAPTVAPDTQYVTLKGVGRVPVENPPPAVADRPRCACCGSVLYPLMENVTRPNPMGSGERVVARRWTGEWDSYGDFCSTKCTAKYAQAMLDKHGERLA